MSDIGGCQRQRSGPRTVDSGACDLRDDLQWSASAQHIGDDVSVDLGTGRDEQAAACRDVRRQRLAAAWLETARRQQQHDGMTRHLLRGPGAEL